MIRNIFSKSLMPLAIGLAVVGCNDNNDFKSDGPKNAGTPAVHQLGDPVSGKNVFLFETFGNERFWTDAMRLPAGIVAAGVTPLQAIALGLQVDVDQVDAATRSAIASELATDSTGRTSPTLNNPATTIKLINENAILGLPAKDSNNNGSIDIANGDKVGASCTLCHGVTDGSVFNIPGKGSIGKRRDGLANHNLDFGTLISIATNSRAYYPVLQLALSANGGNTLGRATAGLTETSTEAQVDAYLTDKALYPVGMFDDTPDGNGDPMHNMPLFRQDLAFPFGSEGALTREDNFANLVYTALLDPTNLTTTGGRKFLTTLGGTAAGNEIVDDYISVLAATGVTGYPFLQASPPANAADAGNEDFPLGVRVNNAKLLDMNAFLFSLPAPAGVKTDLAAIARGREIFRGSSCTGCHNVDQGKFVPTFIVPMKTIFPGDNPQVLLAMRQAPLNPILNTANNIFDDKMAVVNASLRGLERGTALPLLLDLARKPVFLHDNSVPSLNALLDPSRGSTMPHPFFLSDAGQRADVVAFLNSLDTSGN